MSDKLAAISPHSAHWLYSFGDLLTLLLCFFISILSLSPLNPALKSNEKDKNIQGITSTERDSTSSPIDKTTDGTGLANYQTAVGEPSFAALVRDYEKLDLWLAATDFSDGDFGMQPQAAAKLKSQVVGSAYELISVRIESCAPNASERAEASWATSMSRILTLRSQMIDAGAAAAQLGYRVLGPHCGELRGTEAGTEHAVARIRIERKVNNG